MAIAHIPWALSLTAADKTWLVTVFSYRGGQGPRLQWPCGCQSTTRRGGDTRMRTIGAGRSSLHARQRSCSHPFCFQPMIACEFYSGRLQLLQRIPSTILLTSRAASSLAVSCWSCRQKDLQLQAVSNSVVVQTRSYSIR